MKTLYSACLPPLASTTSAAEIVRPAVLEVTSAMAWRSAGWPAAGV
jgi:hypothetical protein